jgi:hypothetical protein
MGRNHKIGIACSCLLLTFLTHCAGTPHNPQLANQCHQGLHSAFQELDQAKAEGFSGTVSWTKAATLLSTAKLQQQFDKFPNCINKVKRARFYIKESQKT